MKLALARCVRCGKTFDFDMYSGLCPECGCFHRKPGVSAHEPGGIKDKTIVRPEAHTIEAEYERHIKWDEMLGRPHDHKTTTEGRKTTTEGKKTTTEGKKTTTEGKKVTAAGSNIPVTGEVRGVGKMVGIVVAAAVIVLILASALPYVMDKIIPLFGESVRPTEGMEIVAGSCGEEHTAGDYTYVVSDAYALVSSEEAKTRYDVDIPDDSKLVIVSMDILYSGEGDVDYGKRTMPYVNDGTAYREYIGTDQVDPVLQDFGVYDMMISGYDIYVSGERAWGFIPYLVDADADMITVCCECRSGDSLKEIYEVSLPVQKAE